MAVTQISRIQIRRGPKQSFPTQLAEGEIMMTTDTGEVFVGAPHLEAIAHRGTSGVYPYQNLRVLTELDVVRTLHDHIVTTGPLMRVTDPSRASNAINAFVFEHIGPLGSTPVLTLNLIGTMPAASQAEVDEDEDEDEPVYPIEQGLPTRVDLRGRIVSRVYLIRGTTAIQVPINTVSVSHVPGPTTLHSRLQFDRDELPSGTTFQTGDQVRVDFFNLNTLVKYSLAESDAFVMNYSMVSDVEVNDIRIRRTGTLLITADEYSVVVYDNGVDLNQDPGNNFMRVVFSGYVNGDNEVILSSTNLSHYPVSIAFSGTRWKHSQ